MEKGAILRPEVRRTTSTSSSPGVVATLQAEHRGRGLGHLRGRRSTRWSTRRTPTTRSTTRASCAGSCPTSRRPTSTSPPPDPRQVCQYSGPEPPSGGVRRPPLAVIAPHCDAVRRLDLDRRRGRRRPRRRRPCRPAPGTGSPTARRRRRGTRCARADVVGLVVARLVAGREHRRELVEGELAVGLGEPRARSVRRSGCSSSGSGRHRARADPSLRERRSLRRARRRRGSRGRTPAQVAHLVQLAPDEARRAPTSSYDASAASATGASSALARRPRTRPRRRAARTRSRSARP